jgi:hypothetical protein
MQDRYVFEPRFKAEDEINGLYGVRDSRCEMRGRAAQDQGISLKTKTQDVFLTFLRFGSMTDTTQTIWGCNFFARKQKCWVLILKYSS